MTEVLQVQSEPTGQSYFESSGLRRSRPSSNSLFFDAVPISTHSKSSPSLVLDRKDSRSIEQQKEPSTTTRSLDRISATERSSIHSPYPSLCDNLPSPHTKDAENNASNYCSTCEGLEFPQYHDTEKFKCSCHVHAIGPLSPSQESDMPEYNEGSVTDDTISDTPLHTPTVVDDTAVKPEPSRQVDFLSHEWREEDIWSSWRNIVSQRKTVYGERSRLENASWRTWAKSKYRLRTVAPERLNWLKESDVTWLYGPLTTAASYPITQDYSEPQSQISKNNSFIHKKPILKKRSMSEVMLQKSLSTSSLLKQAAASVQAQGKRGRTHSSNSDCVDSKLYSELPSRDQLDYFTSRSNSSGGTPYECHEKKHIRFDNVVEQCIAVDCKDIAADEDEDEVSDFEEDTLSSQTSDSSSDDGLVMKRKKRPGFSKDGRISNRGSRSNSFSGRKIIETLPATTLKYRTDSPDINAEAQHHTFARSWNTGKLSPSPSQETLRPSNPSSNFLLPPAEDDENNNCNNNINNNMEIDLDSNWSFGASNPKSSLGASASGNGRRDATPASRNRRSTGFSSDQDYEVEGMRRTESGMFMPYDEDEDEFVATGLFGRVSEAINTARDIGHVIWNVGWRR